MLFALFGRIMGALTSLVARSPPFSIDPVVTFSFIFGGGGLLIEACYIWWWLLGSSLFLGFLLFFSYVF